MDYSELLRGRVGFVSSYDAEKMRARVCFPDKDNLVSAPLPVIVDNTLKNKEEFHLDEGEKVFCVFLGNGYEMGFILGSYYDDKNPPAVGDRDRWVKFFEDGTHIFVDRKEHIVQIKDSFDSFLQMQNGQIIIQSSDIMHLNPKRQPAPIAPIQVPEHISSQFD